LSLFIAMGIAYSFISVSIDLEGEVISRAVVRGKG
jgi:hypothetical protein